MKDKQSKLPEEVEGLVGVMADKTKKVLAHYQVTDQICEVLARQLLTRIVEHTNGRAVILKRAGGMSVEGVDYFQVSYALDGIEYKEG